MPAGSGEGSCSEKVGRLRGGRRARGAGIAGLLVRLDRAAGQRARGRELLFWRFLTFSGQPFIGTASGYGSGGVHGHGQGGGKELFCTKYIYARPPYLSYSATSLRVTASHPNSAVKLSRAQVVVRWGTTSEGWVLNILLLRCTNTFRRRHALPRPHYGARSGVSWRESPR